MKNILYGIFALLLITNVTFGQTVPTDDVAYRNMMNTYAATLNTALTDNCPAGITIDQFKRNIVKGTATLSTTVKDSITSAAVPLKNYGAWFATNKGLIATTDAMKYFYSSFAPSTAVLYGKLVESSTAPGLTGTAMWNCALENFNTADCGMSALVDEKNSLNKLATRCCGKLTAVPAVGNMGVLVMIGGFADCVNSYLKPQITRIPIQEVAEDNPEIVERLRTLINNTESNQYVIDSTSVTKITKYNGVNYTFTIIPEQGDNFVQNIVIEEGWGREASSFLAEYQLDTAVHQVVADNFGNHILNSNILPIIELPENRYQISQIHGYYTLECYDYGLSIDLVERIKAPWKTASKNYFIFQSTSQWVYLRTECEYIFHPGGPTDYHQYDNLPWRDMFYTGVGYHVPSLPSYASVGKDGEYNESFWNNPHQTFPHQNLPKFIYFSASIPRNSDGSLMTGADNVYSYIGGDVLQARLTNPSEATENTCALKVSRALNYSGVTIPYIDGQTIKGGDGKYYFLNARNLNLWMRETFGTYPTNDKHISITTEQAGYRGLNLPNLLNGKKGIFSLVSSNKKWASGHADFLKGDSSDAKRCHFNDSPIDYIDVWILE